MTWLTMGLLAWGAADAAPAFLRGSRARVALMAALLVLLLGAAGAWGWASALVGLVTVAAYAGWVLLTAQSARATPRRFVLALLTPAAPLVLGLLLAGAAPVLGGVVAAWTRWAGVGLPGLERALLVLGAVLLQVSTANVVVRLVLAQLRLPTTRDPDRFEAERTLKGGRFIGPLERVLLVLLGLAGQLTAGTLIAAAKGIIRFPELTREDDAETPTTAEYVLVGTLASWAFAIVTFVLLR